MLETFEATQKSINSIGFDNFLAKFTQITENKDTKDLKYLPLGQKITFKVGNLAHVIHPTPAFVNINLI